MKKFYLLFAVLVSSVAIAQNYNFVDSTATYADLTAATSLKN